MKGPQKPRNARPHNREYLNEYRRDLRKSLTPAEAAMWKKLQRSKLEGRKFRRQHSVGNYILDFFCVEERLAIELDGEGHYQALGQIMDQKRRAYLAGLNIKVLRFENREVFEEPDYVLLTICENFGWWEVE